VGIEVPSEPVPIACTLDGADMRQRAAAWRALLGSGLVERRRVPGGVRFSAREGARATLLELLELERECCPWMDIEVADGVATITSDRAEGRAVLALLGTAAGVWMWRSRQAAR